MAVRYKRIRTATTVTDEGADLGHPMFADKAREPADSSGLDVPQDLLVPRYVGLLYEGDVPVLALQGVPGSPQRGDIDAPQFPLGARVPDLSPPLEGGAPSSGVGMPFPGV